MVVAKGYRAHSK